MAKNTIILHLDWKVFLDVLPDAELGQWTRAIMHYMETGEPPADMSTQVAVAFYASFERIGRDRQKWEAKGGDTDYRKEAGRLGGLKSGQTRRAKTAQKGEIEANEANRSKLKQNEAVILSPVSCNLYPVSSSSDDRAADAGTTTMTALIDLFEANYGQASANVQNGIQDAAASLGPELTRAIMESCIDNNARGWSYIKTAFAKAKAQGLTTVEQYQLGHMRAQGGQNARVDRETPSGNDIIRRNLKRPLRLKRED